jgi:hypothetical protein
MTYLDIRIGYDWNPIIEFRAMMNGFPIACNFSDTCAR